MILFEEGRTYITSHTQLVPNLYSISALDTCEWLALRLSLPTPSPPLLPCLFPRVILLERLKIQNEI